MNNMINNAFVSLQEDVFQHITTFLPPKDLTRLVATTSRTLRARFDQSEAFWRRLAQQAVPDVIYKNQQPSFTVMEPAKHAYLRQALVRDVTSLRWIPLIGSEPWPEGREGHLAARLGSKLIITGGFSDDPTIYLCDLRLHPREFRTITPTVLAQPLVAPATVTNTTPAPQPPIDYEHFIYGSTITVLDDHRCLRFGGFCSGGYSSESHQAALLTISNDSSAATWQVVACRLQSGQCNVTQRDWVRRASRSYHTSTLLYNRYLVALGGMQSQTSTWEPIVLDTHTWTWLDVDYNQNTKDHTDYHAPAPRHGHSVVHDVVRNRLVLFGGGSGSDLLRSGEDHDDVWECRLPTPTNGVVSGEALRHALHTGWSCLYEHSENRENDAMEEDDGDVGMDTNMQNFLSRAERLHLGRCHKSHRISADQVLLLFGSGKPTTSGALSFDLARNAFRRPAMRGRLPIPRFTCVSIFVEELSCILVHGGFSVQRSSSVDDSHILDLAGPLLRECPILRPNSMMASNAPITEANIEAHIGLDNYHQQSQSLMAFLTMLQFNRQNQDMDESDEELDGASSDYTGSEYDEDTDDMR